MSSVTMKEIFVSSFSLYIKALPKFIWIVLPLLVISNVCNLSFASDPLAGSFRYFWLSIFVEWIAGGIALVALLRVNFPEIELSLSIRSFMRFFLVSISSGIAMGFGAVLMIFPAFWVWSAFLLAPVFVFVDQQAPIDSIKSSMAQTKGNRMKIAWLLLLYLFLIVTAGFASNYLPQPLAFLVSLALSVAGLYYNALVVIVYASLLPSPPLNIEAPQIDSALVC
jgi:hypothetical protein